MPLYRRLAFRPNPAPADSSYGIWLKHLVMSQEHRPHAVPRIVAELGPGLSLGVGLAALICGAERYIALDAVRFAPLTHVLPVFDRLVELFVRQERPENATGFPSYEFALDAPGFPSRVLPAEHMTAMLDPARIAALRRDVQTFVDSGGLESSRMTYIAPWTLTGVAQCGEIDFLLSHTVLQHVQSVDAIWQQIGALLCSGGVCSHQVNFDSHGTSAIWNGHWVYPEAVWRIALGRKTFLINREPLSRHITAARKHGLQCLEILQRRDETGVALSALAPRWKGLAEDDRTTRGALIVARKG